MEEKRISPAKAIRLKCLDCCCGSSYEVERCPCKDCSLYPFRFGKNPYTKPALTDEQRREKSERMRKLHSERLHKVN